MSSLLLDSNILITGERDYYPHDIFPSVWEAVSASIVEKRAIVLDVVYKEIVKGQGWLAEWMKRHKTYVVGTDQQDIVDAYQQVLAYVFNSENKFTKAAKDAWFANIDVADPWLIASAIVTGNTIVSFEVFASPGCRKRIKIPNVADHFAIPCIGIVDYIKTLGFVL